MSDIAPEPRTPAQQLRAVLDELRAAAALQREAELAAQHASDLEKVAVIEPADASASHDSDVLVDPAALLDVSVPTGSHDEVTGEPGLETLRGVNTWLRTEAPEAQPAGPGSWEVTEAAIAADIAAALDREFSTPDAQTSVEEPALPHTGKTPFDETLFDEAPAAAPGDEAVAEPPEPASYDLANETVAAEDEPLVADLVAVPDVQPDAAASHADAVAEHEPTTVESITDAHAEIGHTAQAADAQGFEPLTSQEAPHEPAPAGDLVTPGAVADLTNAEPAPYNDDVAVSHTDEAARLSKLVESDVVEPVGMTETVDTAEPNEPIEGAVWAEPNEPRSAETETNAWTTLDTGATHAEPEHTETAAWPTPDVPATEATQPAADDFFAAWPDPDLLDAALDADDNDVTPATTTAETALTAWPEIELSTTEPVSETTAAPEAWTTPAEAPAAPIVPTSDAPGTNTHTGIDTTIPAATVSTSEQAPTPQEDHETMSDEDKNPKVYGIDLGTTYSCIAAVDEYGRPVVIPNNDSTLTTPSVVLFDTPNDIVVGIQAKRQARIRPEEVVSLVKRHMGDEAFAFHVHDTSFSAPVIASQILRTLADEAYTSTQEVVRNVVITVPAYFGDTERKATKLAGELAGLNVIDIINEPTAAALAYGLSTDLATRRGKETVLVYDLGGGTFDVTVITLDAGSIDVVATDGDHALGGADFDERLAAYLGSQFLSAVPTSDDPLDDTYGIQDLITLAEDTKVALSRRESVDVLVMFNGARTTVPVSRSTFQDLTQGLLDRTLSLTRKVLGVAAAKGVAHIDRVLLVGGSSKMPFVAETIERELGLTTELTDPDLSVAKGAALYGQKKELEAVVARRTTSLGADEALRSTASDYNLSTAAVTGLITARVSNVTSRAFGILAHRPDSDRLWAEFFAHQNDTLPLEQRQTLFTLTDDQSEITVNVVEQASATESDDIDDVRTVVSGSLPGVPKGYPAGTPVSVVFTMNTDQTISVVAHHPGCAEPLTLSLNAGLTDATVHAQQAQVATLRRA